MIIHAYTHIYIIYCNNSRTLYVCLSVCLSRLRSWEWDIILQCFFPFSNMKSFARQAAQWANGKHGQPCAHVAPIQGSASQLPACSGQTSPGRPTNSKPIELSQRWCIDRHTLTLTTSSWEWFNWTFHIRTDETTYSTCTAHIKLIYMYMSVQLDHFYKNIDLCCNTLWVHVLDCDYKNYVFVKFLHYLLTFSVAITLNEVCLSIFALAYMYI